MDANRPDRAGAPEADGPPDHPAAARLDPPHGDPRPATSGADYAHRLQRLGGAWWKRWLNVQAPYRWNVRRLRLGRTLDIGCGIGRNLRHLDGDAVGVDHNPTSVQICRAQGLAAYTVEEFLAAPGQTFDTLLAAHMVEHLSETDARTTLAGYLPYLKSGGRVVFITPQERGYHSDPTHVWFVGFDELAKLCSDLGLTVTRQYSFPFPRGLGRLFTYNEFVVVARKP